MYLCAKLWFTCTKFSSVQLQSYAMHYVYIPCSQIGMLYSKFTFGLVTFSNGLCPRLHISYMSTPKLHTSLAVEYFFVKKCLYVVTGRSTKLMYRIGFIQTYFYCCPFHRNHTSSGDVIIFIFQISRHTKVSNLKIVKLQSALSSF